MSRSYQLTDVERAKWREVNKQLEFSQAKLKAHIHAGDADKAGIVADDVDRLKILKADIEWQVVDRVRGEIRQHNGDPGIPQRPSVDEGAYTINVWWQEPAYR